MTDLDCRTVADHVSAFVDGELEPDTWRRVMAHLAGCEGCHRYVHQIRWTVRMLNAISGEWPGREQELSPGILRHPGTATQESP